MTKTLRLGDVEVGRIGLGTNRLKNTPENVAFIRDAVEAGVSHIDTAHLYTRGESEETIGAALNPIPDGVIVATKGGYKRGEGRPEVLRSQIEESLRRRLRVEAIPLYYLHRVDPQTPLEASLGVIAEYRDRGRIRHVGISEVSVEQIRAARQVVPIAAVQNQYSLSERKHERVVDYCASEGIPFVPYFPLRGVGLAALADIAAGHGVTPRQVALAWLLRRSPTTLPIPGTLSLEHLRENPRGSRRGADGRRRRGAALIRAGRAGGRGARFRAPIGRLEGRRIGERRPPAASDILRLESGRVARGGQPSSRRSLMAAAVPHQRSPYRSPRRSRRPPRPHFRVSIPAFSALLSIWG